MKKVLVTCPPMLGLRSSFEPYMREKGMEAICPDFVQVMSEEALCEILPTVDGWIIGDDLASRAVVEAGSKGNFRAAVRWGIGVDNVDFSAFQEFGIPVQNTPGMFGKEVADMAVGYVVALARHTFEVDRAIRENMWIKPIGRSLSSCRVGVVGYGDIGRNVCKRLKAADVDLVVWDPGVDILEDPELTLADWPEAVDSVDFLVFTCALNDKNMHMFGTTEIAQCKKGVRVVNVARGGLIDEVALSDALASRHVGGVALDVFETEPLPLESPLRQMESSILGSHNSSNTKEAVEATNCRAIDLLDSFFNNLAS